MKRKLIVGALIIISALTIFKFMPILKNLEPKDEIIEKSKNDIYIKNGVVVESDDFTSNDDFIKSQILDSNYNKISDYGKGFTMSYYSDMDIDTSLSLVKTALYNDNTIIEVYHDDFTDTQGSYQSYVNYSNTFLKNTKDHLKEYESNRKINGRDTHILLWSREKLKHIENDKNYYMSADIKSNANNNEVYTIFMKSSKPFKSEGQGSYMDIIESFRIIDKQAKPKVNNTFKLKDRKFNQETQALYERDFLQSNKTKWGLFENTAPLEMDTLNKLEERLDYNFDYLVRYDFFSSPEIVPMGDIERAHSQGKTVELTFQTTYDYKANESGLYNILKGDYDDYFKEYAEKLKAFNHPILFRLNNEMNGDWCEYSAFHFSKDTEIFKEVWRHIYNIFEENNVDNVLWVWNPHDVSFPNFNWNHYLNYYPGDEYVDIVGLTGYNNGTYYPGEVWREFDEIYDPIYSEYSKLFEHPLMITEFSANSVGGDKLSWISSMFDKMKTYDRIKVAIWWNYIDWDAKNNPARIYRLDESEEMLDIFKNNLKEYK